jgi:parallel beta-helix repeat protein
MIKNKLPLLSEPGEWASEDQGNGTYKVYYWAKDPGELSQVQMTSATVTSLVNATSGMHDFVVSGFEIAGSKQYGIDLEKVNNVVVKNNLVHDNASYGIWMRTDNNIEISNNIAMLNYSGIGIASINHALIKQNEVAYNQNDGMDLTGDVSGKQPGDVGFTPSDDITVTQNYVHNQSYINHSDGIQLYRWLTNVHITNNVIVNNEQGIMSEEVDDVGDPGTSDITGNVIWGSAADLVIFGHNNSNNWTVANNTLGGGGLGMFQMTGFGYNFTDNVIVGLTNTAPTYTGNHNLVWTTDPSGQIFRDSSNNSFTTIPAWNASSGQDAQSVKGDPMFNNVPLLVAEAEVQGSTASSLVLDDATGFSVGQHVEIARDGVLRTITGINGNTITVDVPLSGPPLFAMLVYNWGSRTNFEWDTRLASNSPGLTMSSTGGRVGSLIVMSQYQAGDFNGDGKRDLPTVPADVVKMPDLSWWPV